MLQRTPILLACLLVAACDDPKPPSSNALSNTAGASSGVTGSLSVPVVSASGGSSAPVPTAMDATSGALPSSDPASVHVPSPASSPATSPAQTSSAKADTGAKAKPKPAATTMPNAMIDAGSIDAGVVTVSDAGAPANPALVIAQKVDAIFSAKKTFSARFKQQYTLKVTGAVKDSSGVVSMERPSKISFRYDPPNKNRIVSDGTTLKIYMADDNQMIEMPAQKTAYPGALAFMMGNGISSSFAFDINQKAQWGGGVVLDGKPSTPNPSYETVMFYIDTALLQSSDPNAMKRVLLLDAQGNKNRFDFESITQPPSIPASEFEFTPPAGTEIKK